MDYEGNGLTRMPCSKCSDCCVGTQLQLVQTLATTLPTQRASILITILETRR